VPGVPGGGLADRQRGGGERVQDGGGPAAEGGGDALGGAGRARTLSHSRLVSWREGPMGGVLAAPLRRLNIRPTNSFAAYTGWPRQIGPEPLRGPYLREPAPLLSPPGQKP